MRCATVVFRHVDTQEKSLMPRGVTVKTEEVTERFGSAYRIRTGGLCLERAVS